MTTTPRPDLWRLQGGRRPHVLWDMVDGPMPRGLLGIGDPDVHLVEGRWTMFLGGFSTSFRNRIYRATLADGGTPARGPWQLDLDRHGRAAAATPDPPRSAWDGAGMHTPSYVPPTAGRPARIYYTGRSTRRHYGPASRYAIGTARALRGGMCRSGLGTGTRSTRTSIAGRSRASGRACSRRSSPSRISAGSWTGSRRSTRRSCACTSTAQPSAGTQGARSNYKKFGAEPPDHAIGRSRGGLTTKNHLVCDGRGRALAFLLTPGQAADTSMLIDTLSDLSWTSLVPSMEGGE